MPSICERRLAFLERQILTSLGFAYACLEQRDLVRAYRWIERVEDDLIQLPNVPHIYLDDLEYLRAVTDTFADAVYRP